VGGVNGDLMENYEPKIGHLTGVDTRTEDHHRPCAAVQNELRLLACRADLWGARAEKRASETPTAGQSEADARCMEGSGILALQRKP